MHIDELAIQLLDGLARHRRAGEHAQTDQLDSSLCESHQLRCGLASEQLIRLPGGLSLRVDHQVDPEALLREHAALQIELGIAEAGHRVSHTHHVGCEAGDDVDLITVRHCEEQRRVRRARFFEHGHGSPVPRNRQHIQLVTDLLRSPRIVVDDDDILPFLGQDFGEVEAYGTRSDDYDPHGIFLIRSWAAARAAAAWVVRARAFSASCPRRAAPGAPFGGEPRA